VYSFRGFAGGQPPVEAPALGSINDFPRKRKKDFIDLCNSASIFIDMS
jgi:hypothetical protein